MQFTAQKRISVLYSFNLSSFVGLQFIVWSTSRWRVNPWPSVYTGTSAQRVWRVKCAVIYINTQSPPRPKAQPTKLGEGKFLNDFTEEHNYFLNTLTKDIRLSTWTLETFCALSWKITSNISTSNPSSYPTLRSADSVLKGLGLANFSPMLTGYNFWSKGCIIN